MRPAQDFHLTSSTKSHLKPCLPLERLNPTGQRAFGSKQAESDPHRSPPHDDLVSSAESRDLLCQGREGREPPRERWFPARSQRERSAVSVGLRPENLMIDNLEEPIGPAYCQLFGDWRLGHPGLEVLLECSKFWQCGERIIYPLVNFQQSHIGYTVGKST